MCWMCDHPGTTLQDYLNHMSSIIHKNIWAIQGVQRDGLRPPFAYTVGLTAMGKPELIVTGMPTARAAALLNDVAVHILHAQVPEPGKRVPLIGRPLLPFLQRPPPPPPLLPPLHQP